MAQTATRFAKRPSRSRSSRLNDVAPAVEEAREELRTIALRLAPLVAPYRRHGRLSIRVERMSQLARLSQGRNNGDGSWSLGSDELEDLIYLLPQSFNDPHTLAIRIIGLEGGAATTLALIDLPVSLDDSTSEAAFDPHAGGPAEATDLHREVARLRTELAARNGELAEARRMADAAIAGFSQQLEAELAKMRAAFAAELDERLAAAAVEAAAELQERREAWQAEHSAKLGVSEARERERMAELRERWQRETEAAILKAEKAWKSEEAKRSEAREREWQEKLQEALAQAEAGRSVARGDSDEAVARLRETVARLQAALAQHEAELDQAKREKDEAQRHWQAALQAALLDAERRWQEAESARAQAAERLWQSRIAEAVAEAQADKARSEQSAKAEHRRLEEEVSNLRARLAEREQALDQVRSSAEEAQKQWLRRNADALAKAEAEWRQAEIARFAAAQAEWEQRLARQAKEARAERETAQAAIADLRARGAAEAQALREAAYVEIDRLTDAAGRLEQALAAKESELAAVRAQAEETAWSLRRDAEAIAKAKASAESEAAVRLAEAEAEWRDRLSRAEADAAARLAANQSQWREQVQKATAEASARVEEAEAQLARARAQAGAGVEELRRQWEGELSALSNDRARLQQTLAEREQELAEARLRHDQERRQWEETSQAAMATAKAAWKADEAIRLSAAEVQWRKQSSAALTDALARAEAAEAALAEIRRAEASRGRSDDIVSQRLRDEVAELQARLIERDAELTRLRVLAGEAEPPSLEDTKIIIRTNHDRDLAAKLSALAQATPPRRRMLPAVIGVAALAASLILFYPVRSLMLSGHDAVPAVSNADVGHSEQKEEVHKILTRDVNIRTGPSTSSSVIVTLPKGRDVVALDERSNWMLVRFDGDNGKPSRQGWVAVAFVKDAAPKSSATRRN